MLTFYRYDALTNRFTATVIFDLSQLTPFRPKLSRSAAGKMGRR